MCIIMLFKYKYFRFVCYINYVNTCKYTEIRGIIKTAILSESTHQNEPRYILQGIL